LETKDDPDAISSWVFFHCDEDGDLMICDTFQTLISRELPPEQRASDIEKSMQGDPVKEFREGIGRDCDKMKDLARVSKTGKGIDGRPLDPKTLQDYIPVVNAVIAACANPTVDTVRGVMEIFTDRKIKTCKVSNFYSKMQFKWNEQTQNWFSQEGPFGPCGTINIFTLETDKDPAMLGGGHTFGSPRNSKFCLYTQKRLFTNPGGQLSNGLACSKFSEHVTRYTWRTSTNIGECRYIEHQVQ
jgi:hypothetical protein